MRKKRVIIFDDQEYILDLLTEFFSSLDYEVQVFSVPVPCPIYAENTNMCRDSRACADIIISDFKMPLMNGYQLLEHQSRRGCKLDSRNKAIISGDLPPEYQRKLGEMGCKFYEKPFEFTELLAWVDDCEQRMDLTTPLGVRRSEVREQTRDAVRYARRAVDDILDGTVVNISNCGMCLMAEHPLAEQELLVFQQEMPNSCQSATVRWVEKNEDRGVYVAGLSCC